MPTSLVDILRWRADHQPHQLAYRFLVDGEQTEDIITYKQLDRKAQSIAAWLQKHTQMGDRVLLLFPPGLDFIAAYLGCLYAGNIAIPAYPPHPVRLEKSLPNLLRIQANASPTAALLTQQLLYSINAKTDLAAGFSKLQFLATDQSSIDQLHAQWQVPSLSGDEIAFLQYTSGSTRTPRGVMISHQNLLHNLQLIETAFGVNPTSQGIIWLPPYHDMGLIGGILAPLYSGIPVTLMPHLIFLQRPLRWLQAISNYKGSISGGPNFAYDLCVKKIKIAQRDELDLSNWEVAFNGAEPIHPHILDRFADYFAPCGFRKEAFFPCYGLAEGTLMVTGGPRLRPLITAQNNRVSSGQNLAQQDLRIVDPETHTPCKEGETGEIWVRGPSIAKGYWNHPEATTETFGGRLHDEEKSFLRTGDLGMIQNGELFVTGRLKNLIIIDGKNHHPHDIETTVKGSFPAIYATGCAAFSVEREGKEKLIIVVEINPRMAPDPQEIIKTIRKQVAANHDLKVADIKLCMPGAIARTTSGKIRHFLCKEHYLTETLKEITYA